MDKRNPDLLKGEELMVNVYQCDGCGEISTHPKDVGHLDCPFESDGAHVAADYTRHVATVRVLAVHS